MTQTTPPDRPTPTLAELDLIERRGVGDLEYDEFDALLRLARERLEQGERHRAALEDIAWVEVSAGKMTDIARAALLNPAHPAPVPEASGALSTSTNPSQIDSAIQPSPLPADLAGLVERRAKQIAYNVHNGDSTEDAVLLEFCAATEAQAREIVELKNQIGTAPAGSYPDEQLPRDVTWHKERQNWQHEVAALRLALNPGAKPVDSPP